jgi:hypothetical protein
MPSEQDRCIQELETRFVRHHPWGDESYTQLASGCVMASISKAAPSTSLRRRSGEIDTRPSTWRGTIRWADKHGIDMRCILRIARETVAV